MAASASSSPVCLLGAHLGAGQDPDCVTGQGDQRSPGSTEALLCPRGRLERAHEVCAVLFSGNERKAGCSAGSEDPEHWCRRDGFDTLTIVLTAGRQSVCMSAVWHSGKERKEDELHLLPSLLSSPCSLPTARDLGPSATAEQQWNYLV